MVGLAALDPPYARQLPFARQKPVEMSKFAVILPAAGRSSRFHNKHYKKPFVPLANRAVWLYSADRFLNRNNVCQVILVISPEDRADFNFKFASNVAILGIDVVEGGAERSDSVEAALARVKPEADFVCVHDAARPCLADVWIDEIFQAAERLEAVIFAIPVAGTLKLVGADGKIEKTAPRERLWEAQTPQVFRRQLLLDAYARRGPAPLRTTPNWSSGSDKRSWSFPVRRST